MLKSLNQRGFAPILIIILILLAGLALGVYLVQQRTNIFPKASVSDPIGPETSFSLSGKLGRIATGSEFAVHVLLRSDIEAANLFSAQINYPADLVEVVRFSTSSPDGANYLPVQDWLEQYSDNIAGKASFIGGLIDPGYKTDPTTGSVRLVTIHFKSKASGTGEITIDSSSAIYSNATNEDILTTTRNLAVAFDEDVAVSIVPVPADSTSPEQIILTISPTSVTQGQNISFTWSGVQNPSSNDYIEVYTSTNGQAARIYTSSCTLTPNSSVKSSGTCTIDNILPTGTLRAVLNRADGTDLASAYFSVLSLSSPTPSPVASASVTPTPTASLVALLGDGNRNGRIDLADMSVLYRYFHKSTFPAVIDMNQDKSINSFDRILLVNLMVEKRILRR